LRVHRSQRLLFGGGVVRVADTFVHDGVDSAQVWYSIDDRGACAVLSVGGRIDAENCPGVCDAVLVGSGFSTGLVVDLGQAEFTHAEAAGLLMRALQKAHQNGASVSVVDPPEPVGWLLAVSAQAADIPVRASVPEAVAMLGPGTRSRLP
jgi:anti-anti-sigma regulatory factor